MHEKGPGVITRALLTGVMSLVVSLAFLLAFNGCAIDPPVYPAGTQEDEYLMDHPIVNPEGGYKIRPLKSLEATMAGGTLSMFPVKGDRQSGPGMYLSVEKFTSPVDLNTAVNVFIKNEPSYQFSAIDKTLVDTIPARSVDFTTTYHAVDGIVLENPGADEGETIHGRVIIAVFQESRLFKCVMVAPQKYWSSYEPGFMAAIKTLKFLR